MTDGFGSQSYSYNQFSQLISETRTFTNVGTFTLSYDYNLAGELRKITDATNMTIKYGYDTAGRLNGVTGADNLFMDVSNYASNFQYRAWGGLKAMTDGSGHTSSLLYNSKLLPTNFNLSNGQVNQNYSYHNDGRLSFVQSTLDANFDRSYAYDHMARLQAATSGGVARGDSGATPYNEFFGYDAFNNLNMRSTLSWGQDEMLDGASYTNNRRSGWGYDADGRNTTIDTRTYTFDASGQTTLMTGQQWLIDHYINVSQSIGYDGARSKVKEVASGVTTYYLKSSVLGGAIVEEINSSGQKSVGYVYTPGGQMLARQVEAGSSSYISWKHHTPARTGQYDYNVGGVFGSGVPSRVELDPLGASVPLEYVPPPEVQGEGDIGGGQIGGIMDARWANFFDVSGGCMIDGMAASCSLATGALNSGAAEQCPNNECSRYNPNLRNGQGGIEYFRSYADGRSFYLAAGVNWLGNAFSLPGGLYLTFVDGIPNRFKDGRLDPQKPVPVPRPDPTAHFGMDDNQWRNFMRGYNVALDRLNDPNCLRAISALGGDLSYSAKSVLQGIFEKHGFSYGGANRFIASTSRGILSATSSAITLYDKFFDGVAQASNRNMELPDYSETLGSALLHEIVHALGGGHGSWDTEAGRKEGMRWNDEIYDNCFAKQD